MQVSAMSLIHNLETFHTSQITLAYLALIITSLENNVFCKRIEIKLHQIIGAML